MSRKLLAAAATAAAVAAPVGCAGGDATPESADTTASKAPPAMEARLPERVSPQDETWLEKAHEANLAEIEAGGLAARKGSTGEIRSLGTMLVNEHRRLDQRLAATAAGLGVELPHTASAEQQEKHEALEKGEGRLFDRDFVEAMTAAHEEAVALTRTEISKGRSKEVVGLARQTLPELERHLAMFTRTGGS
ncbi:DUF4142 domain-containing protein [Spirillospora sp. NPDC029432]|uniref:DUF4142 domain-containing protein n=1 Tax=Spirillospora sp. NPDC029432 TaxID=3154599 RepID=UPI0034513095